MTPDERLAVVVLAGGRSRRMGSDKALLALPDGRSALQAVLAAARTVAGQVLLSVDTPEHAESLRAVLDAPAEVVLDRDPGDGPLAALGQALRVVTAPAVLLLAVDMPLVTPELLHGIHQAWLDGQADGVQVAAPVVQGIVQPMPACYASTLAAAVHQLVQAGRRSLRSLFDSPSIRLHTLDEAALRRFDPDLLGLARADTPEAWDELCARAKRSSLGLA